MPQVERIFPVQAADVQAAAGANSETRDEASLRAGAILDILGSVYTDLRPMLDFSTPFQLLIATVLSAQCTDAMVNRTTVRLFQRFPDPEAMAQAALDELEALVHSTGFYKVKARNIQSLSRMLLERHGGIVPGRMEDLLCLPGVGRKTAGVLLSLCFGQEAIIVDTHFGRVARRLGLSAEEDPARIERDLAAVLPQARWTEASNILNRHGRAVCSSRKPKCPACSVFGACPGRLA
jgi:endonuclease-3